jgi:hypothetical protein
MFSRNWLAWLPMIGKSMAWVLPSYLKFTFYSMLYKLSQCTKEMPLTVLIVLLQKSIFLDCETRIESLLAQVFENYKSLDENSPTGLADLFNPMQESAAPALGEAVKVYTLLHDILSQDAQTMLRNYLQVN